MKIYLYLILFLNVLSSDYRSPSKTAKKCLVNIIGKEETNKLLKGLRKYHRAHGKATFYDYILAKKSEYKEIVDECLLQKIKRRLSKSKKKGKKGKKNIMNEYYLQSIKRDKKVKKKIMRALGKKNKSKAIKKCKNYLGKKACKFVVKRLLAMKRKSKKN